MTISSDRTARKRPTWDVYFAKMAMLAAERSTCTRHNVGAVIVKDKRVLSTGYNGAPSGTADCLELGCLRDELKIPSGTRHEVCRGVHAEQNAIIQAGVHGVSIKGGTVYCTHSPCSICAKMVINAGITRFVSFFPYADSTFPDLFREAGVEFQIIEKPSSEISYKP